MMIVTFQRVNHVGMWREFLTYRIETPDTPSASSSNGERGSYHDELLPAERQY